MIDRERAQRCVERLGTDGRALVEVFAKEGRSRRSELSAQGPVSVLTVESGWAVRAGGAAGSFFCAGTGAPGGAQPWPSAGGAALRLPAPQQVPPWEPGPEIEAPLLVEGEAQGIVDGVARELASQVAGARVLRVVLDDGSSESYLANSRGVDVGYRSRLATLHVEAILGGDPTTRTVLQVAEREARRFQPRSVAERLANVLVVRRGERLAERDRGEMILAPPVGARLFAALAPLWLGEEAAERAAAVTDRHDHLASAEVTIVDDGRLAGGALAAPVDGEGSPTRRLVVVERGRYRQPIVDWRRSRPQRWRPTGCIRRPGWRERPRPGPSHLFVAPDSEVSVAELVSSVARGFYLLDTLGGVRLDLASDRFAVEVCGFTLAQGKAEDRVGRAWLCGGVGALLRGVRAVARDLAFLPLDGMVGAPSLLVRGLELRREL